MHNKFRLRIALLIALFSVACVGDRDEEQITQLSIDNIKSKDDLMMIQSTNTMLWQWIRDTNIEYANICPEEKTENDVLPLKYSINDSGHGFVWVRELQAKPTDKELVGLRTVFDPPYEWIQFHCTDQKRKLMREYGFSIREKLVTKNTELIYDHLIDESTCADFEEMVSYNDE